MFWGLTIEPGKHYSQTVDQSFHVSMAALDTREKSGITQLLVRHEKAEFLLCTLQYGDNIPYPCLQQPLDLNLDEGSEISFYSEGKGTIHLTGYLVTDEPMAIDPSLLAEAQGLLVDDDEEEEDEEFDSEDDEEEEDYSDSDMESASSADLSWKQLIENADEEDDSDEEEWTPKAVKKGSAKKEKKENKRKSLDDSASDEVSFAGMKKKRKAAAEAETLSKNEMAAEERDDEEEDEEEDDGDFIPADEFDDDDDDDDDEEYSEEEDDEEDELEGEDDDDVETPEPVSEKPAVSKQKAQKKANATPTKMKTEEVKKESQDLEQESEGSTSQSPLKKKKKKKQQKVGEEDPVEGEMPLKRLKADNKENIAAQKKEKQVKKQQQQTRPIKLKSGTVLEDIVEGQGKLAKPGKRVFVYYRGVLAKNQKEFDSCTSGKAFMFTLGRGEVIKGWEEGIRGMKVGGKRKVVVPPSQGYGSQKVGPIPANSTLEFEVELKQVK